jgi:hypothetical protein
VSVRHGTKSTRASPTVSYQFNFRAHGRAHMLTAGNTIANRGWTTRLAGGTHSHSSLETQGVHARLFRKSPPPSRLI